MANQYILGEKLDSVVDGLVASGQFKSHEEVLREGVLLLKQQSEALEQLLAPAIADMKAGRVIPAEEVFDRLEAKYKAMVDAAK